MPCPAMQDALARGRRRTHGSSHVACHPLVPGDLARQAASLTSIPDDPCTDGDPDGRTAAADRPSLHPPCHSQQPASAATTRPSACHLSTTPPDAAPAIPARCSFQFPRIPMEWEEAGGKGWTG